jgi:hypothetical protein
MKIVIQTEVKGYRNGYYPTWSLEKTELDTELENNK